MKSKHDPVEQQIREAIERGEFDNLPGSGRPLPGGETEPGWWARRKIQEMRRLDRLADLARHIDEALEALWSEYDITAVRTEVARFNAQIEAANQDVAENDRLQFIDEENIVRIWRSMYRARANRG